MRPRVHWTGTPGNQGLTRAYTCFGEREAFSRALASWSRSRSRSNASFGDVGVPSQRLKGSFRTEWTVTSFAPHRLVSEPTLARPGSLRRALEATFVPAARQPWSSSSSGSGRGSSISTSGCRSGTANHSSRSRRWHRSSSRQGPGPISSVTARMSRSCMQAADMFVFPSRLRSQRLGAAGGGDGGGTRQ